jgi:hypothetical protein
MEKTYSQRTMNLVLEELRDNDGLSANEVIDRVVPRLAINASNYSEFEMEVREALWELISSYAVTFTSERKLFIPTPAQRPQD